MPSHTARVAAESSPRAPRDRGGPIGSRSAAHGARREEQDDQRTQTSQEDRDPHAQDPPVAWHGPATLVHRSWHRRKGRRAGLRLYGRPFGGGPGRSGFRRQCIGCRGGDPSASRPCPVPPLAPSQAPWRPATHQGRSPSLAFYARPYRVPRVPSPQRPTTAVVSPPCIEAAIAHTASVASIRPSSGSPNRDGLPVRRGENPDISCRGSCSVDGRRTSC
jgi:hypothetical protein